MRTLLSLGLLAGLAGLSAADDPKADPTGTWVWETEWNGQKTKQTLKLKLDGDKLSGVMVRRDTESKIEDAKFKDGEVSFTFTRDLGGEKRVTKYKGKVDGDTLKMTQEWDAGGEKQKREIEAKREKKDN